MIQDIYPSKLNKNYIDYKMTAEDYVLWFNAEGKAYVRIREERIEFVTGQDVKESAAVYLFSVDNQKYFLLLGEEIFRNPEYGYYSTRELRDKCSGKELFAVFSAYHLWKWYTDNRYCGRCADSLEPGKKERSLVCPSCGNVVYPRINPAVIVGVIKGEKLLITRYRKGYAHNALVAGFTEFGETLEETVAREVMEETGVKVKNIRYYKSQPWGMAQDILVGFFCEAEGDGDIRMDENELKYAEWVSREDIVLQPNNLSGPLSRFSTN
ncbi:MAG: NAD(+) diphosphatase [Lachnospiraceae bacterium]|nr:NAD(+) diphosphatase [Lachnospiraceae bacterium]